jgi:hypothetical protein
MKDEARKIARLAKQCGQEAPMVQAMWHCFCYRTSRQIGYLIMAHEMEQVFAGFASSFSLLVKNGRSPLEAMNDFYEIALGFAEGEAK